MLMHVLQRHRQHTVCFSKQHVTLSLLLIKKPIPKALLNPIHPKHPLPQPTYLSLHMSWSSR